MSRFVPLTDTVVQHVAAHMRPADVEEGRAHRHDKHFNVLMAVRQSAAVSKGLCWGILDAHGEPMGACGAGPTPCATVGSVWLLGTPLLDRHGKTLVQGGRERIRDMHEVYPVLTNSAMTTNTRTLAWLKHLGFHFLNTFRLPPRNVEFVNFVSYK